LNNIDPTAVVDPSAILGTGNTIGPHCYIGPDSIIGDNNNFTSHVVIGSPAQHKKIKSEGYIKIGHNNVFREFSQVQQSCDPSLPTYVGNYCYLMKGAHVAHDCVVENFVTMANDVFLGGHTRVMMHTNIGPLSAIHQGQTIGSFCQIGMGSVVPKNTKVEPGTVFAGNPAQFLKKNERGLTEISSRKLELETIRYRGLVDASSSGRVSSNEHGSMRVLRKWAKQCGTSIFEKLHDRIR
jgi:UDP-N-acetylglucosamine acyltransferase